MMPQIQYCPSLLEPGFDTYSPRALKRLFGGKKVSHILDYEAPWITEEDTNKFTDNAKRISISGVQEKYSLIQENTILRLTRQGERGTHILKPMPTQLKRPHELPLNEHLTMQIAAQVFKIQTADCGLVFFKNGEVAYLTRRFDVREDGSKRGKEDFATLVGKSSGNAGSNFKYDSSYEAMGAVIKKYVPAAAIEMEKFFRLVLFNYLFSNGDAHLKNFALLESDSRDHLLSPAYDLVDTRLHIDDADFALDKGLFEDGFMSQVYQQHVHAGAADFRELSQRLGMSEKRTGNILSGFLQAQPQVEVLVSRTLLSEETKNYYLGHYHRRLKNLEI